MSRLRDASWKRFQKWREFAAKRPDIMAIIRRADSLEVYREELDRACKAFKLDATKPKDLHFLLGIFVSSHFPITTQPKVSPEKKRDWRRVYAEHVPQLKKDAAAIKEVAQRTGQGNPRNATMIAWAMQHFWPDRWGKIDVETLARAVRENVRK
jgi:hypothetical protein